MENKTCIYRLPILLFFIGLMIFQSACFKKGEDDPFISFYTRDNRISGNWKLNSLKQEIIITEIKEISFNKIVCDTSLESSESIITTEIINELNDNKIESEKVVSGGSQGVIKTYNIIVTYLLEIKKDGSYTAKGSYRFSDDDPILASSGSFSSGESNWYWSDSHKRKTGIVLINFPIIDITKISVDNIPIVYVESQSFEVKELRNDKISLSLNKTESLSNSIEPQEFYIQSPVDTPILCQKKIKVTTNLKDRANWGFKSD